MLIKLLITTHFILIGLYNFNITQFGIFPNWYTQNFFPQNWKMFSPNPPEFIYKLNYSCANELKSFSITPNRTSKLDLHLHELINIIDYKIIKKQTGEITYLEADKKLRAYISKNCINKEDEIIYEIIRQKL